MSGISSWLMVLGLTMQTWQLLLIMLYLLPFAIPESCTPTLNVSALPVRGSHPSSILPPAGCNCTKLRLTIRGKGAGSHWQVCRNLTSKSCTWLFLPSGANLSLHLEGWYLPVAKGCQCSGNSSCSAGMLKGKPLFVHGLQLHNWNVSVSAVPLPSGHLSFAVVRQFCTNADADAGRVFFRQLEIHLLRLGNSGKFTSISRQDANCSGGDDWQPADEDGRCSVLQFGNGSTGLQPGSYVVTITTPGIISTGHFRRELRLPVEIPAIRESPSLALNQPGRGFLQSALTFLLAFLAAFLFGIAACLAWKMWSRRARSDQALLDLGTILLLPAHSRVPELSTIKTRLQKLGARTHDFQERDLFCTFQRQPCVSTVLKSPALREARLVFVCAELDAPPLRSPAAELWESVLRFVRNWKSTELVVLTTPGGPGPETAGLLAARAFVVPDELDKMALYLHETKLQTST